jgi:hypothetical protein
VFVLAFRTRLGAAVARGASLAERFKRRLPLSLCGTCFGLSMRMVRRGGVE